MGKAWTGQYLGSGRAKEATDHIKAKWPGASWIIEMLITTETRRGHQVPRAHYFLIDLRTKPEALLRLIRQRWLIENDWKWPRHTQMGFPRFQDKSIGVTP